MSGGDLRKRVLTLYKTLLYMGRDYPQGYEHFRQRCNLAFKKNKDVQDPKQIKKLVIQGEFVVKELKALYYLRKYRTLKKRYYDDPETQVKFQHLNAYEKEYKKPDS